MRVVSLVPSWTETLLAAGVDVVGRTRYCIHPQHQVGSIPVVGGTKDWDFAKVQALHPDLLLLDREENPKFMAEQYEFEWLATHVQSLNDVARELQKLSVKLSNAELQILSERWKKIALWPGLSNWKSIVEIPGLLEWGLRPEGEIDRALYMIWKNPWMCVDRKTFIGSILSRVGFKDLLAEFEKPYPEIDLNEFSPKTTLLLFSSEPYPFLKRKNDLKTLGFPHAFVDGESFSWFGLRSLKFLENLARE